MESASPRPAAPRGTDATERSTGRGAPLLDPRLALDAPNELAPSVALDAPDDVAQRVALDSPSELAPPPAPEPRTRSLPRLRTPRIALLGSRGIPARYGGFETFAEELSVRLVARGVDVTVFCEGDPRGAPREHRGVKLVHVRPRAPGPLRTIAFDAQCLAAACRGYDVVYMLGYGASAFCALPRLFGREVWINMDGLEWRRSKWSRPARWYLKAMEGAAFRTATRLVFDNGALRDEVEARRGRARRSSVIEYGAPLCESDEGSEVVEHFGLVPGEYHLAVARLEPENHLHEIVRAHRASGARKPLAIVTNVERGGDYARELRALAGRGTKILGSVYEPERLRPLRRHAWSYVHGHSVGGTNPSLLEAMGAANFVLAHDNPFNREVLQDGARFWRDETELARVLAECDALGPAAREVQRALALARAKERYGWERIADEYAALLRECVS